MDIRTGRAISTIWIFLLFLACSSPARAQISDQERDLVKTELHSPWERSGEKVAHNKMLAAKSCFSLLEYRWSCLKGINISYGNRFGDNWDILALHGTQSRMIDLGVAEWSDKIDTPYIEPFRAPAPGEKRHVAVNTSGGDGADGRPGLNADGSLAPYTPRPKRESYFDKPIAKQVSSKTESETGELYVDNYNPFLEAIRGHMYAIRVLEDGIDQYFLMRVDDVIKGQKISISIRKTDLPSKRPIF